MKHLIIGRGLAKDAHLVKKLRMLLEKRSKNRRVLDRPMIELKINGCWLWLRAKNPPGYGQVRWNKKYQFTHRLFYTKLVGPIPKNKVLDHLCRVPLCCNPAHLEPVLERVNLLRGISPIADNARKTSCKNGHPFDRENTTISKTTGKRGCRKCMSVWYKARYQREKEKRKAAAIANYWKRKLA